jgi:hypothetical protein
MIPEHRFDLLAPSEWDVVLSPELAPLFVLDAAIVAAHRVLCIGLDPSSFSPGGAGHPPTRAHSGHAQPAPPCPRLPLG